jgi:nucleolar protein 56
VLCLTDESFELQREKALGNTKNQIKVAYAKEEFALMQAINAYLETSKSYNLMYERLSEWYGIYYPEIKVGSQDMLAELALVLNDRGRLSKDAIKAVIKDDRRSADMYEKAMATMGREMTEGESKALLGFARLSKDAKETLDELDVYIKKAATSIMPNVTYLTDEKIAAELLSKAGSLERLATMPASTLQLLGAEKALFKHLKFGSKPPKYGVLFKLQQVSSARRELRGRVARFYATKLSIAARADAFSKRFIAKELKEIIDRNIRSMRVSKNHSVARESAPRKEWSGDKGQKSTWSDRPPGSRGPSRPRQQGRQGNFRPFRK